MQKKKKKEKKKKRKLYTEKSYNYAFSLRGPSLESAALSWVSQTVDLDSASLALETTSLIVKASLEQLVLIGG